MNVVPRQRATLLWCFCPLCADLLGLWTVAAPQAFRQRFSFPAALGTCAVRTNLVAKQVPPFLLASNLEHGRSMQYRAVTTSVEGFVQQIACCYLRHGYWFYVKGRVPHGKCPTTIDQKLIDKYRINVSESTRARRKKAGRSNLQYIRHESTFVILATKGEHRFFEEEANLIRDIRRVPIRYAGYSISYKPGGRKKDGSNDDQWHAHVEIDRDQYLDLRAWFSERALRDSPDRLAKAFYELPIAPYAPVRRQMLLMLREVNRVRKTGGKKQLPHDILPLSRRVVKPFADSWRR